MDAGYAWQVLPTSLSFPCSLNPTVFLLFLFPYFLLLPVLFYEQVEVSWGEVSAGQNKGRFQRNGGAIPLLHQMMT